MNIFMRDLLYNKICSSPLLYYRLRPYLLRLAGVKIGTHVTMHANCFIGNSNLHIGDHTYINYNVWFNPAGGIKIGKYCNIAYNVQFVTSTHDIGNSNRRAGANRLLAVDVGDGCWIGAGAIVLPGVHIGAGSVVAAGSVVTKDVKPNTLVGGNPAKIIRKLDE